MAENDETPANAENPATADETLVGAPVPPPAPTSDATPTTRFADRVWTFRAMVGVALASLLIGGGIGSAIAALSDDEPDHRMRVTRFSDGPGRGPMTEERGRGGVQGPGGGMREFRQEFRDDLDPQDLEELQELRKQMREEMREQMQEWRDRLREQRDGTDEDAPEVTPSPSAS